MKRITAIILALALSLSLCACGKKNSASGGRPGKEQSDPEETPAPVVRIDLNPTNFYDYFVYKEYRSAAKDDDGNIESMQILYGFALKDGFTAAASPEYNDTLKVVFTANGIVKEGSFTIDYDNLTYTGAAGSTEVVPIEEDLVFWAKGNRTEIWAFGNYNKSYVMYLQDFTVKSVSGCIYLVNDF